MTRLGIGTYAFAWSIGVQGHMPATPMGYDVFLETAADLGVGLVQIADNLPLDALDDEALNALVVKAKTLGIDMEVGTRGIAPEHLLRYLDIAQRCGSPIVRVVVDTATHHPTPDEIVSTLRELMPAYERANVSLAIENHDRFPVAVLADILRRIDSPHVGICLDTVNSFGSLEGPEVVVQTLAPYVVNLHVKDFTIQRVPSNMGFTIEGTPAGQGKLDVPSLVGQLQSMGRQFSAILELWPSPEVDIEATVEKEHAWARESVDYLKTFLER